MKSILKLPLAGCLRIAANVPVLGAVRAKNAPIFD